MNHVDENNQHHYKLENATTANSGFIESNNVFHVAENINSQIVTEKAMNEFLELFNSEIGDLKLSQKSLNVVYKLCISLLRKMEQFNTHVINDNNDLSPAEALNLSTNAVCNKLSDFSTHFKRCKNYESNDMYVPSQQLSLGVRWDMVIERDTLKSTPTLKQCKFDYVSITQTIIKLFEREDFRNAYLSYNESNASKAVEGVYTDFRSGSVFKKNELFRSHPNSLQIEIGTDDFESCNALASKATLYKLCGVYFSIKNIPPQYRSNLKNIFVVALCASDDLKTKYTDYNDISIGKWHLRWRWAIN